MAGRQCERAGRVTALNRLSEQSRPNRGAIGVGRRHRGMALLLVLVVVSALTIVGLAAVSTATLNSRSGEHLASQSSALQAAQSGVEVAALRLSRPWEVGLSWGELWSGTEGFVPLPESGAGGAGRCEVYYRVTITDDASHYYVTSTGVSVVIGGSPTDENQVKARSTVRAVLAKPKLEIPYAVLSDRWMRIPGKLSVTGNVFVNGDLTVWFGGRIYGNAMATGSISNLGLISGSRHSGAAAVEMPPIATGYYLPSYSYDGLEGSPVRLTSSISGELPTGVPGNPDNVYYSDSDTFIYDNAVLNGTLLIKGDLLVRNQTVINACPGMPALIVEGDMLLSRSANLSTNGLVQVGGTIRELSDGLTRSNWSHSGPLLLERGGFASDFGGTVSANYRLDRVEIRPVSDMPVKVNLVHYSETD